MENVYIFGYFGELRLVKRVCGVCFFKIYIVLNIEMFNIEMNKVESFL